MLLASNVGIRMQLSPRTVLLFRINLHVLSQGFMYHSDTGVCVCGEVLPQISVHVINIKVIICNTNSPSLLCINKYNHVVFYSKE